MIRDVLIYISAFIGVFAVSYYFLSLRAYKKFEKQRDYKDSELPIVTIIIPAYNEEKTIERTIHSALNLFYPKGKLDVIVVDDGSKDKTYQLAMGIKNSRLQVYTKSNGGKAKALNYAIPKARGKFIVTMDADSYAEPDSLRKMINFFTDEKVVCVTPSMVVYNPKGLFWQGVQQAEYLVGIFLRKAFSTMNAMHVTPGAFSSYRKSFFEKYGGFDVGNITEDMEMALRIQSKGYTIRCSDQSVVYTNTPNTFKSVLVQRRRWYYGWIHNLLLYRKLFSKKYGHMGLIVLPVAVFSIMMSIILTLFIAYSALGNVKNELLYLKSINFSFSGAFDFSFYTVQRFLYYFFSKPSSIILVIFLGIVLGYMIFARRRVKNYSNAFFGMSLFVLSYSILLTFWWLLAAFYYFVVGKVKWGKQ